MNMELLFYGVNRDSCLDRGDLGNLNYGLGRPGRETFPAGDDSGFHGESGSGYQAPTMVERTRYPTCGMGAESKGKSGEVISRTGGITRMVQTTGGVEHPSGGTHS